MTVSRPALLALAATLALSPAARAAPRFEWDGGPAWVREFALPVPPSSADHGPMGACRPLPRSAPELGLHYSDVDGGETARWRNHEGRPAVHDAHAIAEAGGRLGDWGPLSIRARPRLSLSGEAARLEWLEALATLSWDHVALDAGRTRLWLGPARRGSLLLSNNAPPLDLIHLRAGGATTNDLPILRRIRAVEGGLAVATLRDENRDFANPELGVAHMALFWSGWLEVDLYRTLLFGGEGRDVEIDWGTVWDLILARGENHVDASKNLSDQLASIAFVVRPRELFGAKPDPASDDDLWVFYEYAGEDNLKGILPGTPGVSLGLYGRRGAWDGGAELAVNRKRRGGWYAHPTYTSGYTYRGEILGHHMGGDAQNVSAELGFPLPARRAGRVALEQTSTGYLKPPEPARVWTFAAAVERIVSRGRFELAGDVVARWRDDDVAGVPPPLERLRASVRVTARLGSAS